MLRLLLSPRWLGLLLVVVVVGLTCVALGRWQFHRYDDRVARNVVTERNLAAEPRAVDDVLSATRPPSADDEWREVVATGRYDPDRQVVVSYRTRDGAAGVDVVVPLVTASGVALVVDRGWVATANNADAPEVPAPPAGEVTVTGWVRIDADGEGVTPQDGAVRAISSQEIGATLPYEVYDGFVDLTGERPSSDESPLQAEEPDLSSGPHFFYGIQWWFFGLLAFGFWGYFAWVETRDRGRVTAVPPVEVRAPE